MDEVREERRGPVVVLTLDRPAKRNALTPTMLAALDRGLRAALDDDAVAGVVISGAPPAFCAGMDLNFIAAADHAATRDLLERLCTVYERVYTAGKPVVAAVNGAAVAGGAGLVSACDFAVAAETATLGYPEVRRGLVATIIMPFLRAAVGEKRALQLLLSGESISAAEAWAMGLVSECVADTGCVPRAVELVGQLAAHPAGAYAETKRVFRAARDADPVTALQQARALHTRLTVGAETRDAIARFLGGP